MGNFRHFPVPLLTHRKGEGAKILDSPQTANIPTQVRREDFAPGGICAHAKEQNFGVSGGSKTPKSATCPKIGGYRLFATFL